MKIVTLANEKGGVGKTTLATHLAAGLALKGQRVMLVDADPQGHATRSMGLKKQPGIYDLLVRDAGFSDVVRVPDPSSFVPDGTTLTGALYILPGNIETRMITEGVGDNLWLFQERFDEVVGEIDVVVIDTSPTPSLLHGLIYMATDYIIYPTELEDLSLDGLANSLQHKTKANSSRTGRGLSEIQVMGIQPTMYRVTNAHDYNFQLLLKQFGRTTWPAIPQRTIWVERATAGKMLFAYAPEDEATTHAWALAERVLKGIAA